MGKTRNKTVLQVIFEVPTNIISVPAFQSKYDRVNIFHERFITKVDKSFITLVIFFNELYKGILNE